jgi:excisionase family DNA binding protein
MPKRRARRRPGGPSKPTKVPEPPKALEAAKPSARARRDEYLTPTQVADRLLVATVTVRLWASRGLLPSVTTLGGHRRFRAEDVEAFVERHQRANTGFRLPPSRVLIIDDDPQFARYLTGLIMKQASGTVVEVAHDGFSAGVKCQSMRPDIVTLDLQMPEMDGFEVCTMLRQMFGTTKPRIVALTGFASRANIERILAVGADACLAKTTPPGALLEELGLKVALKT